jgi:hypothetical protein
MAHDCDNQIDPLKLVREGTSQESRAPKALDPSYAPVNGKSVADGIVFAKDFASHLLFTNLDSKPTKENLSTLFANDMSVLLAVGAIEDINTTRVLIQSWFSDLNNRENFQNLSLMQDRLGYLFSMIGTMAIAIDGFSSLPDEIALRGTISNLVRTQLAPAMVRLIAYYRGADALGNVHNILPSPSFSIFRKSAIPLSSLVSSPTARLSTDWYPGSDWTSYLAAIHADTSVFGHPLTPAEQINHCATHNLFRSVFDQFLKVYARIIVASSGELQNSITSWNRHEPHFALYMAFLRLLEKARASANTLTQRHLDFYYRDILGLKEKKSEPSHVHLLATLGKQVRSFDFAKSTTLKAGKDSSGKDAYFTTVNETVANQAVVKSLMTVYCHKDDKNPNANDRIYASPMSNSSDGKGEPLTNTDGSFHPFFNKISIDGKPNEIHMPKAEIGFAIASHYFLLGEGDRVVTIEFSASGSNPVGDFKDDIQCFVTGEKDWIEFDTLSFQRNAAGKLELKVSLNAGKDATAPFSKDIHRAQLQTHLPVLMVKLRNDPVRAFAHNSFLSINVTKIEITVSAKNLKAMAVSNDFGPLDISKPFQPFGPSPIDGSCLTIGSREIFQKSLTELKTTIDWQDSPKFFPSALSTPILLGVPDLSLDYLSNGKWAESVSSTVAANRKCFDFVDKLDKTFIDKPDFDPVEGYSVLSRHGFFRMKLARDIGQNAYRSALLAHLNPITLGQDPGPPPTGPTAAALSVDYKAKTSIMLNSTDEESFKTRKAQFFHITPFGVAEQQKYLNGGEPVTLVPKFTLSRDNIEHECQAEFYIGISGLVPPQSLALLFQVVDGSANPLVNKPDSHISWSYLRNNRWVLFDRNDVSDRTDGLLNAGIVTFSVPRDASRENTLLPSGQYWLRAAVNEASEAVGRLQIVAAQAIAAVFEDRDNASDFLSTPLALGTINKLATPDSSIKSIAQPFPTFGGRSAEPAAAFYTRISERLRHKDRAIDLWDYEHLILDAFPQIYKVKCLNHTRFETNASGTGVYRELAPGNVTIIPVVRITDTNHYDPLKPYTSLAVLKNIESYLQKRCSGFTKLHVRNPQFEEVRVEFKVRLFDGLDETHAIQQLKLSLTRFLSPWASKIGGAPSFGGKILKSALINFIEDQSCVDFVTDFKLFVDVEGKAGSIDFDEVAGSRAVSILVSVPASKHQISTIKATSVIDAGEACGCDR